MQLPKRRVGVHEKYLWH